MKIGLVLPGFSANERDWCIPALLNFVRRLAADNVVRVFALEYPFRRDVYSVYSAVVHSMNGRNRGKWHAPRLWSDTLAAIRAEHRRAPFDVLHAFWANAPSAIAILAGRALNVPVIASVAGGELVGLRAIGYGGQLRATERLIAGWTMRAANRVTVGSRYMQAIAARWRPEACVLPLGVDAQMFAPGRNATINRPRRIVNVGSLIPVKGQAQLLDAFARLARKEICLDIVGSGALERELRERALRLGIAERVLFSGSLAHDALPAKYRAADVFVQSSFHEAQGMAVLEAAASGIPVVGTPVGILRELTGGRADDLAQAVTQALENREQLGQQARRTVEQEFSLEATWHKWMELYRRG
ncbi:MAG: glycosyltransferase [Chloroflexi bacterium]|nr:glycosyltransferase [Chloroflexota bacterium]